MNSFLSLTFRHRASAPMMMQCGREGDVSYTQKMVVQTAARIVACTLTLFLVFGSVLHGTIEHAHGATDGHAHEHSFGPQFSEESGGEGISIVWQTLHGALYHEDAYALVLLGLIELLLLILIVCAMERRVGVRALLWEIRHGFSTGRWLTSGLAPYRRFA